MKDSVEAMICLCCGIHFILVLSLFLEGFLVILYARTPTHKVLVNTVDLKKIRQLKTRQTLLFVPFNLVHLMTFMNTPPTPQFLAIVLHL